MLMEKEIVVKASSKKAIELVAGSQGYQKHEGPVECPNCRKLFLMVERRQPEGTLFLRSVMKLQEWRKKGHTLFACECGYRKSITVAEGVATLPPTCSCGRPLPSDRKKWCEVCRPRPSQAPETHQF